MVWAMVCGPSRVESSETGLQITGQIQVLVYVKYHTLSLVCNSLEILDMDGHFEMGANSCCPTAELLIPKTEVRMIMRLHLYILSDDCGSFMLLHYTCELSY